MTQNSGTESLLYPVLVPELWVARPEQGYLQGLWEGSGLAAGGQDFDRTLAWLGQQRYGKLKGNHKEPMRGFMRQVITAGPREASSIEWVNELLPFTLAHEGKQMYRNLPSGPPDPDAWVLLSLN